MYFMHAPAHLDLVARQYLAGVYPNRWISQGGLQLWPPRALDLNPLIFSLWGHLKSLVYTAPIENIKVSHCRFL